MDKELRNRLRAAVVRCRELLEYEIAQQLESTYGVRPTGSILAVEEFAAPGAQADGWLLRRHELLDAIAHIESSGVTRTEAVEQFRRGAAFTALNRLVALKLMEHSSRGLIQESVGHWKESRGFILFQKISPEACRTARNGEVLDAGYRLYIECLFSDMSIELRVLFDSSLPESILFPSDNSLRQILDILNDPAIESVWGENETLGWVYQYFTPRELRKRIREEHSAPLNSYELAFLNQFYTPRYVVEFLTDNTLARMWWEMRRGDTALVDRSKYLFHRKHPSFFGPDEISESGEGLPDDAKAEYVQDRAKRDPRDLKILDPACGSGHFLLYAYELLELIYEEAWSDPDSPPSEPSGKTLHEEYPDLDTLRRAIPDLILRHNLHGIDIDARATQIAAMALWLQAQRTFQKLGLKAANRPRITRSNIVCAEPMPGERDLLEEFIGTLEPERKVLSDLVRLAFRKMSIAGEAGSLLKIDEELRNSVSEARAQWLRRPRSEQLALLADFPKPHGKRGDRLDASEFTDESFWQVAEARLLETVKQYANRAIDDKRTPRRLFAEDAAQGFAFMDLCRRRYDVVLMNPPFGQFVKTCRHWAREMYPLSYNDIFAAFVERFLDRLSPRGLLGAITSRTGFFLGSFSNWRTKVVLNNATLQVVADLGPDVMDEAMVETAAYVLESTASVGESTFIRLLGLSDREAMLPKAVAAINDGDAHPRVFLVGQDQFSLLPESAFVYWVGRPILERLVSLPTLEATVAKVRQGLATSDDPRFVRALWEVPVERFWPHGKQGEPLPPGNPLWIPHVKAGTSQPWFSPITVVVNWGDDGTEIRNFMDASGKPKSRVQNTEYYFRPGFSWTRRAVRLIPYAIPSGCIPTVSRYMAYPHEGRQFEVLGVVASNLASAYMRFYGEKFHWPNFLVDTLKALPWVDPPDNLRSTLAGLAEHEVDRRREAYRYHEPFHEFTIPDLSGSDVRVDNLSYDLSSLLGQDLDAAVASLYGLSDAERSELERDLEEAVAARQVQGDEGEGDENDEYEVGETVLSFNHWTRQEAIMSYAVGVAFGRWDVRLAQDPTLIPALPGPFDPLPLCPPGMLVAPNGLPARSGQIVSHDWLRARRNVKDLPDEEQVPAPTINDEEYPAGVAWDGVLVDDPAPEGRLPHRNDIVRRVQEIFEVLFGARAETAEREACNVLGVSSLTEYFRTPKGFFEDHIRRYSKSRRKAPIYWLLQSSKRSYGVWLYYHRLDRDTIFKVLRNFVDPKINREAAQLREMREKLGESKETLSRRDRADVEREMERQEALLVELGAFRRVLEYVTSLGYDPDLNDGVSLNLAPFHELVPWKEPKTVWRQLLEGKHEWSTIARLLRAAGIVRS